MAQFCFATEEGRRALFFEAALRGWVAALYDFPRYKSSKDCTTLAQQAGEALRQEVCCATGDNEAACQRLIGSAWVSFYTAVGQASERELTVWLSDVKRVSVEEALAFARQSLPENSEVQTYFKDVYAQYVAAISE